MIVIEHGFISFVYITLLAGGNVEEKVWWFAVKEASINL